MRKCFMCGATDVIECHHIFGGGLRQKSDKYGLTVDLCYRCHRSGREAVHRNRNAMLYVKQYGQKKAMSENNWTVEDFIREFGKNYLEVSE